MMVRFQRLRVATFSKSTSAQQQNPAYRGCKLKSVSTLRLGRFFCNSKLDKEIKEIKENKAINEADLKP